MDDTRADDAREAGGGAMARIVLASNLITDIAYAILDPRIRYD